MQQKQTLNINYPLYFCDQGDHVIHQENERDGFESIQRALPDESFTSVHTLPNMEVEGSDQGRLHYEIEYLKASRSCWITFPSWEGHDLRSSH